VNVRKDFGQKLHGATNCGVCGMTFIRCEPMDELTHVRYHQKVLATLKFSVSKLCRVCRTVMVVCI